MAIPLNEVGAVKYPYRVLFLHKQYLEDLISRIQRVIDQTQRFEGHADAEDVQDLNNAKHDLKVINECMRIAHTSSPYDPADKEVLIDREIVRLNSPLRRESF